MSNHTFMHSKNTFSFIRLVIINLIVKYFYVEKICKYQTQLVFKVYLFYTKIIGIQHAEYKYI